MVKTPTLYHSIAVHKVAQYLVYSLVSQWKLAQTSVETPICNTLCAFMWKNRILNRHPNIGIVLYHL